MMHYVENVSILFREYKQTDKRIDDYLTKRTMHYVETVSIILNYSESTDYRQMDKRIDVVIAIIIGLYSLTLFRDRSLKINCAIG